MATKPKPPSKRKPRAPRKPPPRPLVRRSKKYGTMYIAWFELRVPADEDRARVEIQVAGSHDVGEARRLATWLLRAADWLDAQAPARKAGR